jgi:hypothetical protein
MERRLGFRAHSYHYFCEPLVCGGVVLVVGSKARNDMAVILEPTLEN